MGLVPSNQPNVLFLTQIVLSRVTRAHIFCEGAAQRINKQKGVRNHFRKSISVVIPSSEFEKDLEDNVFDYTSEYEDCECNSDRHDHVVQEPTFPAGGPGSTIGIAVFFSLLYFFLFSFRFFLNHIFPVLLVSLYSHCWSITAKFLR